VTSDRFGRDLVFRGARRAEFGLSRKDERGPGLATTTFANSRLNRRNRVDSPKSPTTENHPLATLSIHEGACGFTASRTGRPPHRAPTLVRRPDRSWPRRITHRLEVGRSSTRPSPRPFAGQRAGGCVRCGCGARDTEPYGAPGASALEPGGPDRAASSSTRSRLCRVPPLARAWTVPRRVRTFSERRLRGHRLAAGRRVLTFCCWVPGLGHSSRVQDRGGIWSQI